MSRLRGLFERLRYTVLRRRTDSELDEEIRYHLDRETRRLVQTGLHPTEARRQATMAFGSVLHIKEEVRREAGFPAVETLIRDLRYGARGLRRSPGFTTAAVVTLGLGIGATTAVYSLVDHVLLRALPYPESDRLIQVVQQNSPDESVASFGSRRAGDWRTSAQSRVVRRSATRVGGLHGTRATRAVGFEPRHP